jgi:hypothetical protein
MQLLEVSCAVRPIYGSLGAKNKTNVMHFLLNLLRIKGLYMLRALLAHRQEVLHKRHLIYCLRVVIWLHQDWCSQLT